MTAHTLEELRIIRQQLEDAGARLDELRDQAPPGERDERIAIAARYLDLAWGALDRLIYDTEREQY